MRCIERTYREKQVCGGLVSWVDSNRQEYMKEKSDLRERPSPKNVKTYDGIIVSTKPLKLANRFSHNGFRLYYLLVVIIQNLGNTVANGWIHRNCHTDCGRHTAYMSGINGEYIARIFVGRTDLCIL